MKSFNLSTAHGKSGTNASTRIIVNCEFSNGQANQMFFFPRGGQCELVHQRKEYRTELKPQYLIEICKKFVLHSTFNPHTYVLDAYYILGTRLSHFILLSILNFLVPSLEFSLA